LQRRIRFDQIPQIVEDALANSQFKSCDRVDELLQCDRVSREFVKTKYHSS
jgi:1-deoxy-D-xylulose 5-phosphate reductoisomerase